MKERTEKAILAGGCFWGMQDLIRKRPGCSPLGWATPAVTWPTPAIETTARTPRRSRSPSTPSVTSYRALLEFFFQIHDPTTLELPGQRCRHELPLCHLLPRRRATPGRRAHHRRRGSLRTLAWQGRHRGQPGGSLQGGRTRASGLPRYTRTATPAISPGRVGCCRGEAKWPDRGRQLRKEETGFRGTPTVQSGSAGPTASSGVVR